MSEEASTPTSDSITAEGVSAPIPQETEQAESIQGEPSNTNGQETDKSGASAAQVPSMSRWRVIKNTIVLGAGSNIVALGRLVVLAAIFHKCGIKTFALYALLTEVLKIAEGLLDFGASEVFVREINQRPGERIHLLRILSLSKVFQLPIAAGLMVGVVYFLDYPQEVLFASFFAAGGLVFQSLVLIYRSHCRAHLLMEREIGAEFLSVCFMFGLIYFVANSETSIATLFAYRLGSTALFGIVAMLFSWRAFRPSFAGVSLADAKWAFKSTVILGAAALLVVVYQAVDLILLEEFSSPEHKTESIAFYSAGQKLSWPLLMGLAAVGSTLYSVVTTHWPDKKTAFYESCQKGFNTTFLLSGLALCPLIAGGRFFLGLLGDELMDGAPALRILALLCLVKAISMTIGPTLFVVHQQLAVLKCIAIALLIKSLLIYLIVPDYSYIGLAWLALGVELFCVLIPSIWLVKKHTGFLPSVRVPLSVGLAALIGIVAGWKVFPGEGILSAIASVLVYVLMISILGAVPYRDVLHTIQRKRAKAQV